MYSPSLINPWLNGMQNLATVDLYRYDEAWELKPNEAVSLLANDSVPVVFLDLRKPDDFASSHIPGAYNLPLQSLNATTASPFTEASILECQWLELEGMFTHDRISAYELSGKRVYVICYNGDTARVATSVLRAKSIEASSIKGGYLELVKEAPQLTLSERGRSAAKKLSNAPEVVIQELRSDSLSPKPHGQTKVAQDAP